MKFIWNSFATRELNGLLLYNGRYNEKHDFLSLEVIDGSVTFSFSLGTSTTRVSASIPGGVSDGEWHTVTVDYYNRVRQWLISVFVESAKLFTLDIIKIYSFSYHLRFQLKYSQCITINYFSLKTLWIVQYTKLNKKKYWICASRSFSYCNPYYILSLKWISCL